jgi:hypothetical protein
MAAFSCWARDADGDLAVEVDRAFRLLATGFAEGVAAPGRGAGAG